MTIAQVEQKIEQTKAVCDENKQKLEQLRDHRAQLIVDDEKANAQKIGRINSQIRALQQTVDGNPDVISLLEQQHNELIEKQKQTEQNKLLAAQKKVAGQVEELSKEFVADLEKAVATNDRLQQAHEQYVALLKQTNESVISKKVCRPSYGMLRYVFEICSKELAGSDQILRLALPIGCPPI